MERIAANGRKVKAVSDCKWTEGKSHWRRFVEFVAFPHTHTHTHTYTHARGGISGKSFPVLTTVKPGFTRARGYFVCSPRNVLLRLRAKHQSTALSRINKKLIFKGRQNGKIVKLEAWHCSWGPVAPMLLAETGRNRLGNQVLYFLAFYNVIW